MIDVKIIKGKMGVEIKGEFFNVYPLPYDAEYMMEEDAYITGDIVMPYFGVVDKINAMKPGFYGIQDGEHVKIITVLPEGKDKENYSIDKVISFDLSNIVDVINTEGFISPEEIELINMSSDFKKFDIQPEDDFLKKIVKSVINTKKVNLKIYANRLPERHHLGNMISSLSNKTKMSVAYFKIWSEILGFDFDIVVRDNGEDSIAPLKKEVNYSSVTNEVEGH